MGTLVAEIDEDFGIGRVCSRVKGVVLINFRCGTVVLTCFELGMITSFARSGSDWVVDGTAAEKSCGKADEGQFDAFFHDVMFLGFVVFRI